LYVAIDRTRDIELMNIWLFMLNIIFEYVDASLKFASISYSRDDKYIQYSFEREDK